MPQSQHTVTTWSGGKSSLKGTHPYWLLCYRKSKGQPPSLEEMEQARQIFETKPFATWRRSLPDPWYPAPASSSTKAVSGSAIATCEDLAAHPKISGECSGTNRRTWGASLGSSPRVAYLFASPAGELCDSRNSLGSLLAMSPVSSRHEAANNPFWSTN